VAMAELQGSGCMCLLNKSHIWLAWRKCVLDSHEGKCWKCWH
jgi:hypothetical protein